MPLFDQMYNFAQWLTQDRSEAEDLVQETFAKALKNFSSFRPGTNFRAWMYRILRNAFLNSRTGQKTMVTIESDEDPNLPTSENTPETILIRRSQAELLQLALADLSVPSREIILLCDVEEMSYHEISELLSIPLGTVMSRLSRARKALRQSLMRRTGS